MLFVNHSGHRNIHIYILTCVYISSLWDCVHIFSDLDRISKDNIIPFWNNYYIPKSQRLNTKSLFLVHTIICCCSGGFYPAYPQVAVQPLRFFPFYYFNILESFTSSHTGEKEGGESTRAVDDLRLEVASRFSSYPIALTQSHCPRELQEKVGNKVFLCIQKGESSKETFCQCPPSNYINSSPLNPRSNPADGTYPLA